MWTLIAIAWVVASVGASVAFGQSPFATRVVSYDPAPGQLVNNALFSDPGAALGSPVGGGRAIPDNSKLATLGGFGGSIVLGFDHRIANQAASEANPRGLDLVVYGNAFQIGGNPQRRWGEPGTIEVSIDANGNGLADDAWYLIRGSHTPALPASVHASQTWDANTADGTFPPSLPAWIPPGRSGTWTTSAFQISGPPFTTPAVSNPLGLDSPIEGVWGYADCSPTMVLGDLDGDGFIDDASMTPEAFYTFPDDPMLVGVTPGSGGGDAIDLDWAIDELTGAPVSLGGIDFVRITSAVPAVDAIFGERSVEVGGVAEVRIPPAAPHSLDFNGDGEINPDDLGDFITAYFGQDPRADWNGDGNLNPDDLGDFITEYFS